MYLLFVTTKELQTYQHLLFVWPVKSFEDLLYIKPLHQNPHNKKSTFPLKIIFFINVCMQHSPVKDILETMDILFLLVQKGVPWVTCINLQDISKQPNYREIAALELQTDQQQITPETSK